MGYKYKKKIKLSKKPKVAKKSEVKTVTTLSKQVDRLVRNFKPELKEIVYTNGNNLITLGQVLGNNNGYYAYDVTPVCIQGVGETSRLGSGIRLKSFNLRFQFISQPVFGQPISFRMFMFRVKGTPITASTFSALVFDTNPFIFTSGGLNAGIIDYNSQFNTDYIGNYQIVAQKKIFMNNRNYSASGSQIINGVMKHTWSVPMEVGYDGNTNNILKNQLILVVLPSAGNSSGSVVSTLTGIPVQAVNTGVTFNTSLKYNYYDM